MRRNSGFTLIELNCALAVATVGIFGVIGMHLLAIDKAHTIREEDVVQRALSNEIEYLRAQPFAALAEVKRGPFLSRTPGIERLVGAQATVTIADRSEGNAGLKFVRARIVWRGENGRSIMRELITLIANKE